MMARIPFPVVATHDICKGRSPVIRKGTPGEITGVSNATPSHYTVTFWPSELKGEAVTLDYLTRTDLQEA